MTVNLCTVPEFTGEEHVALAGRFDGASARQLERFSGQELELVTDRGESDQQVAVECRVGGLDT